MSLVSIIFIFSILFYLYHYNDMVSYKCCSLSVLRLYSLLLCICVVLFVFVWFLFLFLGLFQVFFYFGGALRWILVF